MADEPTSLNPASKADLIAAMGGTLKALQSGVPAAKAAANNVSDDGQKQAIDQLQASLAVVEKEPEVAGQPFHSQDPVAGAFQSSMQADIEAGTIPALQAYADGDPVVWIPAGIKGIFEHLKPKHPFQTPSAASNIAIANSCKIALLGDWGADNDHARYVGEQAMARKPDYMIHLDDIYYSGSESESQTFLKNWPLKDAEGKPLKGRSFALNGNHEMYSLGVPYFQTVLPAFGQEASYFTLSNDFWQFHGLDTAYLPFSIGGGTVDERLKAQKDWLSNAITSAPSKRNVWLTHQQPVSAHLKEFMQAQPLMAEVREMIQNIGEQAIFGWFFGHEHRCTVYDDTAASALFRARLIGNGAIGHPPQTETAAQKDNGVPVTPFRWVNTRSLENEGIVAVSSFALLTLSDDQITVEYIDEDGFVGYTETWKTRDQLGA